MTPTEPPRDAPPGAPRGNPDYFGRITRAFLSRRGAPLMLSAAEIDLLASWEKAGVPADVVLEGIERTFEKPAARARPHGRGPTLAYCRAEVERAWRRWRDRRVGESGRSRPRGDKIDRAAAAADRFLADAEAAPEALRELARRARAVLALDPVDEEALERLDAEADEALLAGAGEAERRAAGPHPARLVRRLRDRHGLPYFAPFNY